MCCFFFFKQKTAYEMRISDWSSDVCSSDLVEQVVRLIRSKGVGVYFVTQNPLDVPVEVLGQLGNRVQHALRAFTPRDQKAVRTAAETFRQNQAFDTAKVITEHGVGAARSEEHTV